MKSNAVFTACVRIALSVALLAQVALAQSVIDQQLQQKARLLSPELAREIALEKEERRAESSELTTQAIKFMDEGDYKRAFVALTEAVNKDPENLTAESKLKAVNDIMYDTYAGYARSRMDLRDYEAAIANYRTALEHKPGGKEALKGLQAARELLEQSVSKNLGKIITEDMTEEQQVDLLVKQARDLEVQSRYEEAKALYKQAIAVQPSNPRPRRLLKELIEKQGRIIADDRRIERRQIMEDLIKAFFQYPERYVDVQERGIETEETPAAKRRAEIIRMANKRLESLSFQGAQIDEVIGYLADESGLSIVLNLGDVDTVPVDIELVNPTVLEAIKYICEANGLTYTIDEYAIIISSGEGEMETRFWSVSVAAMSSAAEAATEGEEEDEMFDLFALDVEEEDDFGAVAMEPEIVRIIKEQVPQPPGSTVYLEPTSGTLVVRNTPGNLEQVDVIINELERSQDQLQVEVQARFVQVSNQDMKTFSFGVNLKDRFKIEDIAGDKAGRAVMLNPTDLTGALRRYSTGERNSRYADRLNDAIQMVGMRQNFNQITDEVLGFFTSALTDPEFAIIWYAIENETNADVLSAPSVTTVSGQSRVSIRQITEVLYPDEYTVYKPAIVFRTAVGGGLTFGADLALSGIETALPGYATVESTLKEDIGIELIVSPTIGEDGRSVSMEITVRVSQEIDPNVVVAYIGREELDLDPILLEVPRFRFQEVKTQVVVNDGETIVLGGMIREQIQQYNDKVPIWGDLPVVGRWFRSEGSYQDKRNLLVFVTSKIITPTGESFKDLRERRLREQAEQEEEQVEEQESTEPVS
jgi:general secretion pathway protein D